MQVYKRILVTMDCSPVDQVIVDHVALLARQNEATVTLLHVVHSHTLDQDRTLREQAWDILNDHAASLRGNGIDASALLRSGEPETEILAEIEENGYDLVAMATHGHTLMAAMLLGSVSRTVKRNIQIPLLLLKG